MTDWLETPQARRADQVLGGGPGDSGEAAEAERTIEIDLLAPEHRGKLVTMLRWALDGREWDQVKDEALTMFGVRPSRDAAGPATDAPTRDRS